MSDLISRQAAIDAIRNAVTKECAEWVVKELPSAQPKSENEPSKTVHFVPNEDFISRKTAIDAINAVFPVDPNKSEYASGIACGAALASTYVKQLPSAQPDYDLSGYSDRLWRNAYERGKAEAQAEQRWIPCSERLPEGLEEVNVTWVNHSPEPYYDFTKDKPFTASAVYYGGKWYWYSSVCADILAEYGKNETDEIDGAIEITAWMPLPEPYRAERRTDE